MAQLEAKM